MAIRPWHHVSTNPVSSRTVGFPESGWRPWHFFKLPSRAAGGLSACSHTPPSTRLAARFVVKSSHHSLQALCPAGPIPYHRHDREPLCLVEALPRRGRHRLPPDQHYPILIAPTGSCARPVPSFGLKPKLASAGLCRLLQAPARMRS
jgi:hypothetical protein